MPKEPTDDAEWKLAAYADVVADSVVQQLAWSIANAARTPSDPKLSAMDLQASRRYLRACMLRAGASEVAQMQRQDFAALWARGMLGAARYRSRGSDASSGNQRDERRTRQFRSKRRASTPSKEQ